VRIVSAFIANHVEQQNTLLYVSGGFPEWWEVTEIPSPPQIVGMGILFEVEQHEVDNEFTLTFKIEGAGNAIGAGEIRFRRGPSTHFVSGTPLYSTAVARHAIPFTDVGPHRITIFQGDELLWEIRFGVRLRPDPS
jgi:hypothetical protein